MGASDILVTQLHELITYCSRRGVLTIMCGSQEGFMSIGSQEGVDVSYLSDSILVLNFFEADATIRRCVAAVKKKYGAHDPTIRELFLTTGSIRVGEQPLRHYRNLMLRGRDKDDASRLASRVDGDASLVLVARMDGMDRPIGHGVGQRYHAIPSYLVPSVPDGSGMRTRSMTR